MTLRGKPYLFNLLIGTNLIILIVGLLILTSCNQSSSAHEEEGLNVAALDNRKSMHSLMESANNQVYRRFLFSSDKAKAAKEHEKRILFESVKSTQVVERDGTAFHLDYSSPKTHPPKNN